MNFIKILKKRKKMKNNQLINIKAFNNIIMNVNFKKQNYLIIMNRNFGIC